jgi:hypothetical protein
MSGSLSPERAPEILEAQIVELAELRNAHARDPRFKQWRQTTLTLIQRIWAGDPGRAERFRRVPFSPPSNRMSAKATRTFYEKGCAEAQHLLRDLLAELGRRSPIEAMPEPDSLAPGVAEDDFPLVDLSGDAPADPVEKAPHIPTLDLPRTPARPAARTPERTSPPPLVIRGTPPPEPQVPAAAPAPPPERPRVSTRDARPAGREAVQRPLREMLGFPIDSPDDAEDPFAPPDAAVRPGPPEPAVGDEFDPTPWGGDEAADLGALGPEDMEPEVEELEVELEADEVPPAPTPAPRAPRVPVDDSETEKFLSSSPVFGANPRPVHRRPTPAPAAAPLKTAAATTLAALSSEVERLGVPEGHRAAVRAMLLDLARALDRQDVDWAMLSESMRLALAYPPLARRVIPLLVPYLDAAA